MTTYGGESVSALVMLEEKGLFVNRDSIDQNWSLIKLNDL